MDYINTAIKLMLHQVTSCFCFSYTKLESTSRNSMQTLQTCANLAKQFGHKIVRVFKRISVQASFSESQNPIETELFELPKIKCPSIEIPESPKMYSDIPRQYITMLPYNSNADEYVNNVRINKCLGKYAHSVEQHFTFEPKPPVRKRIENSLHKKAKIIVQKVHEHPNWERKLDEFEYLAILEWHDYMLDQATNGRTPKSEESFIECRKITGARWNELIANARNTWFELVQIETSGMDNPPNGKWFERLIRERWEKEFKLICAIINEPASKNLFGLKN